MAPAATHDSDVTKTRSKDDRTIPFQGQQPYGMPNDLVVSKALEVENSDERLWVRSLS